MLVKSEWHTDLRSLKMMSDILNINNIIDIKCHSGLKRIGVCEVINVSLCDSDTSYMFRGRYLMNINILDITEEYIDKLITFYGISIIIAKNKLTLIIEKYIKTEFSFNPNIGDFNYRPITLDLIRRQTTNIIYNLNSRGL